MLVKDELSIVQFLVKHGQQDGVLVLEVLMDKWTFDQRAHHLKQLVESRDDELEEKKKRMI